MAKKKKTRVEMRKNRTKPPRDRQWTRGFQEHGFAEEATLGGERVRAKGDMSRKRTIIQEDATGTHAPAPGDMPAADASKCLAGRVLRVHGLQCVVELADARQLRCTVRGVLRSLLTDERNIVATGDRVWVLPAANEEGVIERVEPRHGLLTRASRGREHVIVANVDQVVIVVSLVEPDLKPHLIDRYLVSAEHGGIAPLICLNKEDLIDPALYQDLVGYYSQLGIPTLLTSATTGVGIDRLREWLRGRETVISGQSGVGKSSLLNVIQPELGLRVREISETTQKGKHTTTTAELIKLDFGGWVVDTPGIRQFQLWDIMPEEIEGFFPEMRPFVPLCAYPDCTHTHEDRCAVKRAVERRLLSAHRYESYFGLFHGTGVE
ncbi:ribosome small subunit-dependent GTPase [Planctomycetaceae bacterium SCGC AG-212-F19]|nr:ribosome small subunit-dependent GTPase [Planctomycetaceae bacterium SCGC AG-212-F19]